MSFAESKLLGILVCTRTEKEARKCRKSFGDLAKDVLVNTDAGFLAFSVSSIKCLKEEKNLETEDLVKKGEMVGLESTIGRV